MNTFYYKRFSFYILMFFLCLPLTTPAPNGGTFHATNAGILPYTFIDSKAYFLLGLENRTWDLNKSWAQKARSTWVWTDFGGKCDPGDYYAEETLGIDQAIYCAARECTEETRFAFGNQLPLQPGLGTRSSEFKKSLNYWIDHLKYDPFDILDSKNNLLYTQFFAEVDYIDANKIKGTKISLFEEKKEFRWIPVQEVLQALIKSDDKGFFRFKFQYPGRTNKLFPDFAKTLRLADVQQFIYNTILAKEKVPPIPVTPTAPITPPIPVKPELQTLSIDLQKLQWQLNNLTRQLQALP